MGEYGYVVSDAGVCGEAASLSAGNQYGRRYIPVSYTHLDVYKRQRLVVLMDFDSYVFQVKDLPMIVSVFFVCIYVFALFIMLFKSIRKKMKKRIKREKKHIFRYFRKIKCVVTVSYTHLSCNFSRI